MQRILLIVSIVALAFLSACSVLTDTVTARTLEFNEIGHFRMVEDCHGDQLTLRISGMAGASAAGIKRVEVVARYDELTVKPILVFGSGTPDLDFTITVPPNIKRVLFGDKGYEIWPHVPPIRSDVEERPWLYGQPHARE